MTAHEPLGELHPGFSSADAVPVPWRDALAVLHDAEIYWLSTVRPDGRPHVTPLIAVWMDGAPHIVTGGEERKARNLALNPAAILTTGTNTLGAGLDVVVEGEVERIVDHGTLERIAAAYAAKYPPMFHFQVADAGLDGGGGTALVFRIAPRRVFAFSRGETFGQTRYRMREG